MNPHLLVQLMFVHWVADFVFQSDWMARNKSKNTDALSLHCLVYATVFGVFGNFYFCCFLYSTHFLTDYVTSRITAPLFKNWYDEQIAVYGPEIAGDKPTLHNFFVVIGFDQLIHFATILLGVALYHIK